MYRVSLTVWEHLTSITVYGRGSTVENAASEAIDNYGTFGYGPVVMGELVNKLQRDKFAQIGFASFEVISY